MKINLRVNDYIDYQDYLFPEDGVVVVARMRKASRE